jgi:DNA invertase Pin-like site-specific DNA recombinase
METAQSQPCIAYYRVSTQKQGRSGLGLEAQQRAVRDHLDKTNRRLIAEFVEIESGKNPDRPKLLEALKLCRLTRSKLIVARLDRLARNVAFVSRLMEAGVDFEAVDFPQANRLTIHILAAVAEYEARLISERIKVALAAARARGVKFGRRFPSPGHLPGLEKGRRVQMEKVAARTADLAPVIAEIRAAGFVSIRAVARQLDLRGIRPLRSNEWGQRSVGKLLSRLSVARSVSESKQARRAAMQRWAAALTPVITDVRGSGHKTLESIADELNARGVPCFRGGQWDHTALRRALRCVPEEQRQSVYLTREEFASRLRPVIEEIQAAGKLGSQSIADALNARGIRGSLGGRWEHAQVRSLLKRLSMVTKKPVTLADWLPSLAPVVMEVRSAGHLSTSAMVTELNARDVRTCRGGRWTDPRLRAALRDMRRYKIDYEPKEDAATAAIIPKWLKSRLADWVPSLAPIITEIRAAGHLSTAAMVGELNARGVRACYGGRFTMQRLQVALRWMRKYKIDYEPKEDVALATPLEARKAKTPRRQKRRVHPRTRTRGPRSGDSSRRRAARRSSR